MAQVWDDLLFAHWPLPLDTVRPLVPTPLEIDTFDGRAWIGVVPFGMHGVRLRGTPALPWLSRFLELNVRTYVTLGGVPGVYFFSLDTANPVAVAVARRWYRLPYYRAAMRRRRGNDEVVYESQRIHRGAPPAQLRARYRAVGGPFRAASGSFDEWPTERYCLYTVAPGGRVYRGDIQHPRWPLQRAEAELAVNTMTEPLGIRLPAVEPVLHFARQQTVRIWSPRRVTI
ncbi:MAG: YqjF family protein [Candidatus Rokuibacteriota bacterium]